MERQAPTRQRHALALPLFLSALSLIISFFYTLTLPLSCYIFLSPSFSLSSLSLFSLYPIIYLSQFSLSLSPFFSLSLSLSLTLSQFQLQSPPFPPYSPTPLRVFSWSFPFPHSFASHPISYCPNKHFISHWCSAVTSVTTKTSSVTTTAITTST